MQPTTRDSTPDPTRDPWLLRGHILWAELHEWALAIDRETADHKNATRWLARFATRIRCGDCRRHWEHIVSQSPPDLSSSTSLFAWTVRAHNAVNRHLNKPELPLDAARAHWTTGPGPDSAAADRRTLAEQSRIAHGNHPRRRGCCPEETQKNQKTNTNTTPIGETA